MIKNYEQFTNEDIKSKSIIPPKEFVIDNLKKEYPNMHIKYNDEYDVVIEYDYDLLLSKSFYELLEKGNIKPKDILFENCDDIELDGIIGFTKVSDYGTFGEGIGNFNCSGCENLTSLDGSPEKVGDMFNCVWCKNLTSLDGASKEVGGDFKCAGCKSLTNLEGAPDEVGGNFYCSECENLTSLKGAPEKVGGKFDCYHCNPNFIQQVKAKYGNKVKS